MPKTDVFFDPDRYATVAERIAHFYRSHPNGRIQTELINSDSMSVTFKALVFRGETDLVPAATGWATEREGDGDINTVACLENTETSAIGRALANLGFQAAKERPSVEEMKKADRARKNRGLDDRSRDHAPSRAVVAERSPEYQPEYQNAAARGRTGWTPRRARAAAAKRAGERSDGTATHGSRRTITQKLAVSPHRCHGAASNPVKSEAAH